MVGTLVKDIKKDRICIENNNFYAF